MEMELIHHSKERYHADDLQFDRLKISIIMITDINDPKFRDKKYHRLKSHPETSYRGKEVEFQKCSRTVTSIFC